MSVLSVDEARALITTSLSDDDLQDVIDREESWLARRVGPLVGSRAQSFVTTDGDEVLRLSRHTSDIDVEDDDGSYLSASLQGWADVIPSDSDGWNGTVVITYTPDDEDEVKRALITLVRLTINESPYIMEGAGGFTTQTDHNQQRIERYAAWHSLMRPRVPTTTRLTSAIPSGGRTIGAIATESIGS